MIKQLIKKLSFLCIAFMMTITLTFFLMKLIPGDPFTNKKAIPREILDSMYRYYGFDDPIWKQYVRYLSSALKGDLGPSFKYKGRQVTEIISSGFFKSMQIGLQAITISLVGGISLGTYFAFFERRSTLFVVLTSIFVSAPSFILAAVLQYLFAIKFPLFPVARWTGFSSTILPTLSLCALPLSFVAKMVRNSLLELKKSDAILLAKSKGISSWRLFFLHLLPSALSPVVAFLGFDLASLLAGSFIVENLFAIPGIGYSLVTAVANRDYTVIMGMTMFYSLLFLVTVFLADLVLLCLNPKLREKRYE